MSGDNGNSHNTGLNGLDGNGARTPGMTTGDLLEFAAADALGLLDDDDRAAFDAAFRRAPAAVRDLVYAEQARVAELGLALPDAEAPDELRAQVLERIRSEINRSQSGSPAAAAAETSGSSQPIRFAAHAKGSRPEPRSLGIRRATRVSSTWRIATIGASVAAVVLAVVQVQLRQEIEYLSNKSETAAMLEAVGIDFVDDVLFTDSSVQRVAFAGVGEIGRAEATLVRNADRGRSRLYAKNLASRSDYELVTLTESGEIADRITSFESDDLLTTVDFKVPGTPGELVRVAIMSAGTAAEILFVAEIRLA